MLDILEQPASEITQRALDPVLRLLRSQPYRIQWVHIQAKASGAAPRNTTAVRGFTARDPHPDPSHL